ncbi:MAG: hypothetical protein QG670_2150, partial [Thermoproteota archaeon]|nr:hypothetical protein [Thermoproteota archaeon]
MFYRLRFQEPLFQKSSIMILLICLSVFILPLSMVEARPWNPGGPAHPYLTPKWVGFVAGGGITLVTADVLPQDPGEEVFHAGGPLQPNSIMPGRVTCLSGLTGYQIWNRTIYGVGDTVNLQLADINNDGTLEIIVPLQDPAGLYILKAENGSVLWCADGINNNQSGYINPIGGRVESNPIVGDTDADGYPDIFVGVMAYLDQPNTGKIVHFEWDPSIGSIVERNRVQVWHPCAGGLSLGDTDNDGVFELYMSERSPYAGDGGWGRGIISFWAENLTKRWAFYDWEASSEIPILVDVNRDGVVDIVSANLMTGICVLNSTDGRPLKNEAGTILCNNTLGVIHNHFQASVYDVDGDGDLELLCADGTFGHSGTQVWDLWSWKLDADINSGYSFRGPDIGDVTGDGLKDIIVVTFDLSLANNGTVQIYNQDYQLVDSFFGLVHRVIGSVVQDIDRNDNGFNELLILTQGGRIYCFDTLGLSQERLGLPRARSEIFFYSESRRGVSMYVPYDRPWPDVINPSPAPGAINVSIDLTQLTFNLKHPLGEMMNYNVVSTPSIGSGSGTVNGSGLVTIPVNSLENSTMYHWQVRVNDTSGHMTNKDYWFTSFPVYGNLAPSQGSPILNSTNGGKTSIDILSCYNQTTSDPERGNVTNIYNWLKDDTPIANLVLPFDTKPNPDEVYSGTAVTPDYSGNGNNGNVFGNVWTEGKVGEAFSFDGNDFIQIEEQDNLLDGGGSWPAMSIEFWIKATTTGNSWRLIWKPDRYDINTALSYEIDFQYINNQLSFVWGVNTTASGYNTVSYQTTESVTDWHHVVCTYKSGVGLKIYFDGTQVSANLNPAISGNVVNTNGPLEIAFCRGFDSPGICDFIGLLDEVRLYPSQVSNLFVNRRYNDTKDGLTSVSTIPVADVTFGEIWKCQVTQNDGLQDGQTAFSNQLTITNTILGQPSLSTGIIGSGAINASSYSIYDVGDNVTVMATANPGWLFDHWLLNNMNVGNTNPKILTMNNNTDLTAVFGLVPEEYLFSDGFESGNFNAWTGTAITTGSYANVSSSLPLFENYCGQFTVNVGSGTKRAYVYRDVSGTTELSAYA